MPVTHSYDPAEGFPRVMPSLRYRDVAAALAWLGEAFGLREHLRWTGPDGVVRHAEMRVENAWIELSHTSDDDDAVPAELGRVTHSIVVLVDDVGAHHEHARASGARIVAALEDKPWGLRQYTAEDPEGHRWEFSQFVRHAPPEEWGARLAEPEA